MGKDNCEEGCKMICHGALDNPPHGLRDVCSDESKVEDYSGALCGIAEQAPEHPHWFTFDVCQSHAKDACALIREARAHFKVVVEVEKELKEDEATLSGHCEDLPEDDKHKEWCKTA